jgi:hypothetical protein
MKAEPVIIIGAPRSGTNMLRDIMVMIPGVGTWPCDEINYIWRHGNVGYPSDEFTPEMATPKVQAYIRRKFDKLATSRDLDTVVEKTCANSLRVGFVARVVPGAKYVFIVRDGMDVIGSALERWHASLDMPYILRKARYVPLNDLPYYATRYLMNHVHRFFSRQKRLAFWGPAIDNIEELTKRHSLSEICALQWKSCVDNAERDFRAIPDEYIHRVKYEEFVSDPVSEFERLAAFVGKEVPDSVYEYLRTNVRSNSVGKGRKSIGEDSIASLRGLIADTLARYKYE